MGITTPQSLPKRNANYHKFQDQNIELKQGVGMKFTYGNGDRPLSGYTIKRGVGVGGFGEVYFALNDAGKEVAIKRIQRNLDIEIRGVRQCLNLKHPNLISLYDIRQDEQGESWIVMEFVAGKSLRDAIDQVPSGLAGDSLLRWFGQIAAGVAHLHDNGIVHRDLKPANIFEDNGIVKIGDYGLSKFISCSRRGGQTESVGTFHYMAPEIGKGEYGKEIDIYALGIILYEMLTGTVPFEGETSQEIILKHLTADPDLRLLAPPFAQVVGKALQKNPAARFRDIREMIEPLGLAIDTTGMVTQRSMSVSSDSGNVANVSVSPLAPAPEMIFGKVQQKKGGGNMDPTAYQPRYAAVRPTELRYEEPIAKMLRESGGKLNNWLNSLPNNGAKAAVIVAGIILLVTQGGFLVPLLMVAVCLYIPYYFVWWLMRPTLPPQRTDQYNANMQRPVVNPVVRPQPPVLRPVVNTLAGVEPRPLDVRQGDTRLAATPPRPKLTTKQIRSAQRRQLALDSKTTKIQHLTGSWLGAALVVAVLMTLCALGGVSIGKDSQSHFVALVWSSLAAVTGAWTILGFSKSWESKEGDGASRRFMQLTVGLAIGASAYLLSQFLMVPWNQVANEDFQEVVIDKWSGFYRGDGVPMLPAFLAHFALLFGLVRWWRQADPLRWTRLNVFTLGGSLLAEMIVNAIVPMPQPWGLLVAGGMSAAIQLSSPWRDPSDSPVLAEQAPHQMV